MTTIRAAFYARVSSEQQAAAHTIESQISALRMTKSEALASSSPKRAHIFGFSENVALHRSVKLLARGSGRKIELGVQRVEAKEITVRFAWRRTWPVVANLSEIVAALSRAIVQLVAFR